MAVIYPKQTTYGTKNALVLNPREALIYPFDIGNDWTRIRYGFVLAGTPTGDPQYNGNMGNTSTPYNVAVDDAYTKYYLGLKREGTGFATTDGDYFIGLSSSPDTMDTWMLNGSLWNRAAFGINYKNGLFSGISTYNANFQYGNNIIPTGNSAFASFYSFELKVKDKGLPTQSMEFRGINTNGWYGAITDTSKDNLYNLMLSTSYVGYDSYHTGSFDFHTSNVPYELPNAFFFYVPHSNAHLKIYNVAVVKMD